MQTTAHSWILWIAALSALERYHRWQSVKVCSTKKQEVLTQEATMQSNMAQRAHKCVWNPHIFSIPHPGQIFCKSKKIKGGSVEQFWQSLCELHFPSHTPQWEFWTNTETSKQAFNLSTFISAHCATPNSPWETWQTKRINCSSSSAEKFLFLPNTHLQVMAH